MDVVADHFEVVFIALKSDFSLENGNQKLPHADIEAGFSKIKFWR